jgi:hypothetical protein
MSSNLNDQHDRLGSGQQVCTHAFAIAGSFFESKPGEAANRKASPLAVGPKLCIYEVFSPFNRIFGPTLDCGRLGINIFVLPVNHEYHGYDITVTDSLVPWRTNWYGNG